MKRLEAALHDEWFVTTNIRGGGGRDGTGGAGRSLRAEEDEDGREGGMGWGTFGAPRRGRSRGTFSMKSSSEDEDEGMTTSGTTTSCGRTGGGKGGGSVGRGVDFPELASISIYCSVDVFFFFSLLISAIMRARLGPAVPFSLWHFLRRAGSEATYLDGTLIFGLKRASRSAPCLHTQ